MAPHGATQAEGRSDGRRNDRKPVPAPRLGPAQVPGFGKSMWQELFVLAAFRVGVGSDRRGDTAGVDNRGDLGRHADFILIGSERDVGRGVDERASRIEAGATSLSAVSPVRSAADTARLSWRRYRWFAIRCTIASIGQACPRWRCRPLLWAQRTNQRTGQATPAGRPKPPGRI
jgi:hypothetical protein